jgi:nucleotide-binding universal stress UspA family protein
VSFAEANHVDLIAMATHGRGGLVRLVPGSVAEAVSQSAGVPTLLFPPAARQTEAASRRGAAIPW